MNVVSNVSFAFMFAYMLICSCVAYRARPRKTGERYPVLPATIISLNACVSVVVPLFTWCGLFSLPCDSRFLATSPLPISLSHSSYSEHCSRKHNRQAQGTW